MIYCDKTRKALFASLVSKGHSLFVDGDGWHFDNDVFDSFRDFVNFCESQNSAE